MGFTFIDEIFFISLLFNLLFYSEKLSFFWFLWSPCGATLEKFRNFILALERRRSRLNVSIINKQMTRPFNSTAFFVVLRFNFEHFWVLHHTGSSKIKRLKFRERDDFAKLLSISKLNKNLTTINRSLKKLPKLRKNLKYIFVWQVWTLLDKVGHFFLH